MVQISLPAGASIKRTSELVQQVEQYFMTQEKANIESIFTISGFSFSGVGQNSGMAFINLKDWSERTDPSSSADAIALRANQKLNQLRDAQVFTLTPPAIQGLGQNNGFTFQLLASESTDRAQLKTLRDKLLADTRQSPNLASVRLGSLSESSQLHINIDQQKALSLGLSLSDISSTLSSAWAGTYVNDFIDRDQVKRVYMQGDAAFRSSPDDLGKWYVRASDGSSMTPFSMFTTTNWTYGSESLARYNGSASYELQGTAAPGVSSGAAMDTMEQLQAALPSGTSFAWSGLSYQERLASGQAALLYGISILVVFLCLAALYESWSIPFSVLMVIPLGVVGAVIAATVRGLENDVYFQVALLTTIGLSSKNAILIVEFAEAAYLRGKGLVEAAIEGAVLRLRPIIMTSLAFMAGTLPLALSSGAGANSRISIGSGIVGGTLTATLLAIFMVPLFFVLVHQLFGKKHAPEPTPDPVSATPATGVSHD